MARPVATVLIPTFNHGPTLRFAVDSALAQTVPVEVFIIGDGVPEDGKALIREIAAQDARIRFFDHPKHISRGEPYRHAALQSARGTIVCYLCDRDLWFPDHVARLAKLLESADFAHAFPMHVLPGGALKFFPTDLANPVFRQMMLKLHNCVPFSSAAHRLDFYHQLEQGWDTTPAGMATDWYFFKKFLAKKACRCASGRDPTAITFPSPPRRAWSTEQRVEELALWHSRIDTEAKRNAVALTILKAAIGDRDRLLALAYRKLATPPTPAPSVQVGNDVGGGLGSAQ